MIPNSARTNRILELAQECALSLDHNYVGSEHVLLGLLNEGTSLGVKILAEGGIDIQRVREVVLKLLPPGRKPVEGETGLTPLAKRILFQLAPEEARILGQQEIDGEHLLLAMLSSSRGLAYRALTSFRVDRDTVAAKLDELTRIPPDVPLSSAVKHAIEMAQAQARTDGKAEVEANELLGRLVPLLGIPTDGEQVVDELMLKRLQTNVRRQ